MWLTMLMRIDGREEESPDTTDADSDDDADDEDDAESDDDKDDEEDEEFDEEEETEMEMEGGVEMDIKDRVYIDTGNADMPRVTLMHEDGGCVTTVPQRARDTAVSDLSDPLNENIPQYLTYSNPSMRIYRSI
jgi:hypothetical protein